MEIIIILVFGLVAISAFVLVAIEINPVEFKFFIYRKIWWVFLFLAVISFGILLGFGFEYFTVIGGSSLTFFYFLQKQKLEELKLFKELFKEFNERYERLNKTLDQIEQETKDQIEQFELTAFSNKNHKSLIDYFNLCGEQNFYYTRGYIDPSAWNFWRKGMEKRMSDRRIKRLWDEEKKEGSYYDLDLEFKSHELNCC